MVWTPEEIADWQKVPNAFITSVLAEGRILFVTTALQAQPDRASSQSWPVR